MSIYGDGTLHGKMHDDLGFRVTEASFSGSIYGKVFVIDDYLTEVELARIADMVPSEAEYADTYPNRSLWENFTYAGAFTKTQLLWDHWETVCEWTSDADVMHISGHNKFVYRSSEIDKPHMTRIRERLQVSPAHMREYKPHTDYGAKALTILVPIAPSVSEPTRFHGYNGGADVHNNTVRSVPWDINQAYMFRPTLDHSYHSYIGGEADRYVLNINFMFEQQ